MVTNGFVNMEKPEIFKNKKIWFLGMLWTNLNNTGENFSIEYSNLLKKDKCHIEVLFRNLNEENYYFNMHFNGDDNVINWRQFDVIRTTSHS